jgi:hypothetical protein
MAHFALVNENIVRDVVTIANAAIDDLPFPESESVGQAFIATLPELAAQAGVWWECSYNNNFRGIYPGMGFGFDGVDFIPPSEPTPDPTPEGRGDLEVPKDVDNTVTLDTVEP